MIWLAPLFRVIGGGDAVAATMVLAALADVYENEERYECLHSIILNGSNSHKDHRVY